MPQVLPTLSLTPYTVPGERLADHYSVNELLSFVYKETGHKLCKDMFQARLQHSLEKCTTDEQRTTLEEAMALAKDVQSNDLLPFYFNMDQEHMIQTYRQRQQDINQYMIQLLAKYPHNNEVFFLEKLATEDHTLEMSEALDLLHHPEGNQPVFVEDRLSDLDINIQADCIFWVNAKHNQLKKEYEISSGLADQLIYTEIKGMKQASLRLPFHTMRLHLPADVFPNYEHCFLHEHIVIFPDSETKLFYEPHLLIIAKERNNPQYSMTNVPLQIDMDIESAKKAQCKDLPEDKVRLFSFVFNAILYMTSIKHRREIEIATNPEYLNLTERMLTAKGDKREKLKLRRRSLDPGYRIILGKGMPKISTQSHQGNPLTVRTLVSGFLRNQVYGPAKNDAGEWIPANERLHETIWIQPFWRGSDFAEETQPIRMMK